MLCKNLGSSIWRQLKAPFFLCVVVILSLHHLSAQTSERRLSLAVLDFGDTEIGRDASDKLSRNLKADDKVAMLDRDQVRAGARGAGYSGSLNLSLEEARNLGSVIGCDFFIVGDAQTLRRSPSSGPIYFESYASIFLVSARTGRLITWERPSFRGASASAAEHLLLAEMSGGSLRNGIIAALQKAAVAERDERALISDASVPIIEPAPDDEKLAAEEGLRLPKPYRHLVPPYPDSAAIAEVEGVVDVLVDLDSNGEVMRAEVARWAGFGLDEATLATVRQLHFFPAQRDGVAVPMRVLLRYNFRKPPK